MRGLSLMRSEMVLNWMPLLAAARSAESRRLNRPVRASMVMSTSSFAQRWMRRAEKSAGRSSEESGWKTESALTFRNHGHHTGSRKYGPFLASSKIVQMNGEYGLDMFLDHFTQKRLKVKAVGVLKGASMTHIDTEDSTHYRQFLRSHS